MVSFFFPLILPVSRVFPTIFIIRTLNLFVAISPLPYLSGGRLNTACSTFTLSPFQSFILTELITPLFLNFLFFFLPIYGRKSRRIDVVNIDWGFAFPPFSVRNKAHPGESEDPSFSFRSNSSRASFILLFSGRTSRHGSTYFCFHPYPPIDRTP